MGILLLSAGLCFCTFQGYFYNDDTFNFNYAQAKAALGKYKEAEEVSVNTKTREVFNTYCIILIVGLSQVFLLIQSEKIKSDYVYLSWLARCCTY